MNVKGNWFTQIHLKNFGTIEGWVSLHSEIHCLFFTIVKLLKVFFLKQCVFFYILLGNFVQYILIIFFPTPPNSSLSILTLNFLFFSL